jgi:FAD binding domain
MPCPYLGAARYSKKLPDARAGITLLSSVQAIRIIAMGRALVIGGSLGGLFVGLLLRQSGWDVAVFERSSGDLASRGVGIGTHVEQFEIMRRLGITAALTATAP